MISNPFLNGLYLILTGLLNLDLKLSILTNVAAPDLNNSGKEYILKSK